VPDHPAPDFRGELLGRFNSWTTESTEGAAQRLIKRAVLNIHNYKELKWS
jgi:hypothetical protein